MAKKSKTCVFLFFVLSFAFFSHSLRAQNIVVGNPAEISDFKSAFVNPGIVSFQDAQLALGGKFFHLGFVEEQTSPFRQGFVSLALPSAFSQEVGFGIQAQYFNTPLYSQSNIAFTLSKRFNHIYSFGVKFNLFSRAFNRDNFDLVDPDDPVFRNGTSLWAGSFGAGVAMFPSPYVTLGIGIDHINRANISLNNDNVYQPFKGYLGAVFSFGLLQASVSTSYEEGRWLPRTSIGSRKQELGFIMLGYSENALQAEAQVRVSGPFSLNYSYEYTLFDNEGFGQGSHQFTLIHDFGRERNLPKFEVPEQFLLEFHPPDRTLEEEARFYVYPSVEKLHIIEKKIHRTIDPELTSAQLAQLSAFDIGVLDTSRSEPYLPFERDSVDLGKVSASVDASLSADYENFITNVKNRKLKTNIITSKETYLRAAGLRHHFGADSLSVHRLAFLEPVYQSVQDSILATRKLGTQPIKPQESVTRLSENSTTFQIVPVSVLGKPKDWQFVVEDANGRRIKAFQGSGSPPVELEWDWRDDAGKLVMPGVYNYYLEWRDHKNIDYRSDVKHIAVEKLIRNISIEISNKPKDTGVDADEINIILKK